MTERDWKKLLAPPPADPGFTLRVLAALPPPRQRRERARTWVLLLVAVVVAILMSATVAPALVHASSPTVPVLACLSLAALAFWSVLTVAD
jgi:hypothetical protein